MHISSVSRGRVIRVRVFFRWAHLPSRKCALIRVPPVTRRHRPRTFFPHIPSLTSRRYTSGGRFEQFHSSHRSALEHAVAYVMLSVGETTAGTDISSALALYEVTERRAAIPTTPYFRIRLPPVGRGLAALAGPVALCRKLRHARRPTLTWPRRLHCSIVVCDNSLSKTERLLFACLPLSTSTSQPASCCFQWSRTARFLSSIMATKLSFPSKLVRTASVASCAMPYKPSSEGYEGDDSLFPK
jgi:hypothetical protein